MMFCTLVQAVTVLQVERKQQLKCIMLYQFKAANIKCVWKYMQEPEGMQSGANTMVVFWMQSLHKSRDCVNWACMAFNVNAIIPNNSLEKMVYT